MGCVWCTMHTHYVQKSLLSLQLHPNTFLCTLRKGSGGYDVFCSFVFDWTIHQLQKYRLSARVVWVSKNIVQCNATIMPILLRSRTFILYFSRHEIPKMDRCFFIKQFRLLLIRPTTLSYIYRSCILLVAIAIHPYVLSFCVSLSHGHFGVRCSEMRFTHLCATFGTLWMKV